MGYPAIKVVGGTRDQVHAGFLIDSLGIPLGVEQNGLQKSSQLARVGAGCCNRKIRFGTTLDQGVPIGGVKIRQELASAVMMMNAVAEPYPFGIDHELLPTGILAIAFVMLHNIFKGFANQKIVLVILVPDDIMPGAGRLAEVVEKFFLLKAQVLKTRDAVPQNLKVGELVGQDLEFLGFVGRGILGAVLAGIKHESQD